MADDGTPHETKQAEEAMVKAASAKARLTFDLKLGATKDTPNDAPAPVRRPKKKQLDVSAHGPLTPNGEWMMTPNGGHVRVSALREAISREADEENRKVDNIYAPRAPKEECETPKARPSARPAPDAASPSMPDVWLPTPNGGQVRASVVSEQVKAETSPTTMFASPTVPAVSGVGALIEQQPPWLQMLTRNVLCICLPANDAIV
jgi:hypothetical protein